MDFLLGIIMFICVPMFSIASISIAESENSGRNFLILIAILGITLITITGLLGYFGKL